MSTLTLSKPDKMGKQSWTDYAILILGGGLYYAIKKIIEEIKDRRIVKKKKREKDLTVDAFEDLMRLEVIFDDLLKHSPIERILFLKGSNSGGMPVFGEPYYVQCLMAGCSDVLEKYEIMRNYNKIIVDGNYCELLRDVVANNTQKFVVREMKDSLLARLYQMEGVKYSEIYFLDNYNKNLYFISFASYANENEYDGATRGRIDLALSQIKEMLKKRQV